ncbi:toxin VasX [Shewanella marina]|uniref:toxin VasX n=1 Tax=Shewanella marina TaxID=487319 RepID=UPI0004710AB4|nr:toxin VasX [Shewanella marina]
MATDKLSSGVACEGKKLFIEVVGLALTDEHKFQFYDATDMKQQEFLETLQQTEQLEDTTIFSWDWSEQQSARDVWLSIDGDEGEIKLPLYLDVQAKPRQDEQQAYRLYPILPLSLLPTYEQDLDIKRRLAPTRNGYLYVFYNGLAWREIEISSTQEQMIFKDIDLYQYREARDKPFISKKREATGNPLTDIWLPSHENNHGVRLSVAYSEVQWSAEYLNYLETNQSYQQQRLTAFHQLNTIDNFDLLKTESLPEMRIRQIDIEFNLAESHLFIHDLSGQSLNQRFNALKEIIKSTHDNPQQAINVYQRKNDYQYEYAMKQTVLEALISKDPIDESAWQADASPDYLADARARKLHAIVLDDPLFNFRHHAFMVTSAMGYFQQVNVDMSQQQYYTSAELVHRFVLPKKFGKQENPLHKHQDEFNQAFSGQFNRTLRTLERQMCRRDCQFLQAQVAAIIDSDEVVNALRDITSLNDLNAAGALKIVGYGLSALSMDIDSVDNFMLEHEKQKNPFMRQVQTILTAAHHPLHKILFAPESRVSLEEEYIAPDGHNDGSGYASTRNFANWANDIAAFPLDDIQLFDLAETIAAKDNEQGAFSTVRRIANITDSLLQGYFQSAMKLQSMLIKQGKVVEFNAAYMPVLRTLKTLDVDTFGKLQYGSTAAVTTGFYAIGVEGQGLHLGLSKFMREKMNAQQKPKGRALRMYDSNGKLVVSSSKSAFNKAELHGSSKKNLKKSPLKMLMIPEESELATAMNHTNTQRSLQDLQNNQKLNASNAYERFRVPYFIVAVEMMNLINNRKYFEHLVGGKNIGQSVANITSAILDLGIAIVHAVNYTTINASKLSVAANKIMIEHSALAVRDFTFRNGTTTLVKELSRLRVVSVFAGLLTAAIAGYDSFKAFDYDDTDAAMGMAMVAVGTAMTSIATGLFTTSAPLLFGLGPVAWIGIALAVVGFVVYAIFKDTPIEVWLKNGPFGDDASDDFKHLLDNQTAYYRFIGLLFSCSTKAYKLGSQTQLPELFTQKMLAQGATHVLFLETNLASLMGQDTLNVNFHVRQALQTKADGMLTNTFTDKADLSIIHQHMTATGQAYYVRFDKKIPAMQLTRRALRTYNGAFNIRAQLEIDKHYFPCVELAEETPRNISHEPNFKRQQPLWLNQLIEITS